MLRLVVLSVALWTIASSAALAATAQWCVKDKRIREIAVSFIGDGCTVDYRKPLENSYQEALWRSSYNLEFCQEKADVLRQTLVRGGWACGTEFYVPDGRTDRSKDMAQILDYVIDFRANVDGEAYLRDMIGRNVDALTVAYYKGPVMAGDGDGDGGEAALETVKEGGADTPLFLLSFEANCVDSVENVRTVCSFFAVVPNFSIGGWAGSMAEDESVFRTKLDGAGICPAEGSQEQVLPDDIFLYASRSGLNRYLDHISPEGLWIVDKDSKEKIAKAVIQRSDQRYLINCDKLGAGAN